MLPLLQLLGDGQPHATGDAEAYLAEFFQLAPSTDTKLPRLRGRVTGATTQFKKASLVETVSRGVYRITERGLEVLASTPPVLDLGFLRTLAKSSTGHSETNPREQLRSAFAAQSAVLHAEVLDAIQSCSSECFEQVVLDLLVAMGYGGPRAKVGSVLGRTEDGGLEGIIKAHKLGHEAIYVRAHRWPSSVGKSVVQAFMTVLERVPARKGALITTSKYSKAATEAIAASDKKIFLIDGPELARLMVHHNIGVAEEQRYVVKRVDAGYFRERT